MADILARPRPGTRPQVFRHLGRAWTGARAVLYSGAYEGILGVRRPFRGKKVTIDEELDLLDSFLRRLKVEYDVYFGGGSKRPPNDTLWRVNNLFKKFSDSQKLTFAQRYKFNTMSQRYAIFSDLWRQKLKIKEEGYRRPQDAILGIVGLRDEHTIARGPEHAEQADTDPMDARRITCTDVESELASVRAFYDRMIAEKVKAGEKPGAPFDSFVTFLKKKTEQIRKDFRCQTVEYALEVQDNQVKLKAKPKL